MANNNWLSNIKQKWSNIWYVPTQDIEGNRLSTSPTYNRNMGGSAEAEKNISNILAPIMIPRIKQDIQNWRLSISEAERSILPFRYLMQQIYLDIALDPQIYACIDRRKNLTLLRMFKLVDESNQMNEEWTKYIDKKWFKQFLNYSLDSLFYGYSLISMGDIVNGEFVNVTLIRRGNISPDRLNVAPVPYDPAGVSFMDEPYNDFHIWISTPNEHGLSNCGYGLYYTLAPLAIYSKNNTIYNAQHNELFGMPIRQLKTDKKDDEERNMAKQSLDNMGSKGWIITNTDDELIFHDAGKAKGNVVYGDFEKRLHSMMSKIILGHADALDSTPGKLGGTMGDNSPQEQALMDIQSKDGEFIKSIVNEKLLPLLRKNGINIPENLTFEWSNDSEENEYQKIQNDENIKVAKYLTDFNKLGLTINLEELKKITKLNFEYTEVESKVEDKKEDKKEESIQNILNEVDISVHPNCKCEIDNGLWVLGQSESGPCAECRDAQEMYNSYLRDNEIDMAFNLFKSHKGIE